MSLVTIASSTATANVIRGTIMLPLIGIWTADVVIDQIDGAGFEAGTEVTIASDAIEYKGVVATDRTGDFLDAIHVRVIGGKGGMAKDASLKSYVQPSAFVRDVVNGLMRDGGETISSTADSTFMSTNLTAWSVMQGLVSNGLETLIYFVDASKHWRILPDGTVWIGDESWADSEIPFISIANNPTERSFELGVEAPNMTPGITLPNVGRVSRVEHSITGNQIRSTVWTEIEGQQRGDVWAIQSIVRQELAGVDYQASYRFKVVAQSADLTTVDVNPVEPNDRKFSGMNKVPVRFGTNIKVQFVSGATVMLSWDGGDPQRPYVSDGLSSETVQQIQIAGTHPMPLWDDFEDALNTFIDQFSGSSPIVVVASGIPSPALVAAAEAIQALLQGGTFDSQKVQNG
jgi:hypothetical protein